MTHAFRSSANPALRRGKLRRRPALLLGAAIVPLALSQAAHAQAQGATVILNEGRTPTPVALGAGDDRVVVDISRVDGDTGVLDLTGLTDGPLTDAGGLDTVWLRATGSQTRNVVFTNARASTSTRQDVHADSATGTAFDGGAVYEASGNGTVLRLENRSRQTTPVPQQQAMTLYHGPLSLAGDGTVVLTFSLDAQNQPRATQQALRVVAGASAASGDGKLDVIIEDASVSGGTTDLSVIDVREANSLRFRRGSVNPSQMQLRQGLGIEGGAADIYIEEGSWLNSFNATIDDVTLIRSSGRIYNSAKMSVGGQGGSATAKGLAVHLEGGKLYNILTEGSSGTGASATGLGEIIGGSNAVYASIGDNYIENVGDIKSFTGAAIRSGDEGTTVLRNTIWNFSKGGTRSGNITGGLVGGARVAYEGGDAVDVVVNSGTITGNVDLGDNDDMFLYTGATHGVVNGSIVGGDGIDGYGKSFSISAIDTLNNNILGNGNSDFEMHGVEARGADTVVTIKNGDTASLDAGLMLVGDGTIVNDANITVGFDEYGVWTRGIANVGDTLRFFNNGTVQAADTAFLADGGITSFNNTGIFRSQQGKAAMFSINAIDTPVRLLSFNNSGTLETASTDAVAVQFAFETTNNEGALLLDFVNTGTIRSTGEGESYYGNNSGGVRIEDYSDSTHRIRVTNAGTIETTGRGATVVDMVGAQFEVVNTSIIRALGMRSTALHIGSSDANSTSTLLNSGTISANGGAWVDGRAYGVSGAVSVSMGGQNTGFDLTNDTGGTIEATESGSVAVYAHGQPGTNNVFTLTNRGTIRGGADTVFPSRALPNIDVTGNVLAGAIQTFNTVDLIHNLGRIDGNIDLGAYADEVRNYGVINGDVRLGEGNDKYVFSTAGTLTGIADGGDQIDSLLVDFSSAGAKKINVEKFLNFENLTSLDGTLQQESVSLFGSIDNLNWLLNNIIVNIDRGDTLSSMSGTQGYTLRGGDGRETVNNNGTLNGGLAMGGGDDTVNNSATGVINGNVVTDDGNDVITNAGTIKGYVETGDGDDVVTNSGTITGYLDLGDGNDRYEALGGLVTGTIDGGDGDNDIFVFRMNGSSGSIPGGFANFESFGAYGPGTLTLALNQDYNTIELWEGANLTLQDGTGTVDLITGDDTAQNVMIEDAGFTGGVLLGGGNDSLTLNLTGALSGQLDGGTGTDTLNLNLTGAASINDLFNFEIVNANGASPLTLTGHLGAGQQINFDGSDNRFVIIEGAVFEGNANGGAGTDTLEIATGTGNSRTIVAGQVVSFEKLIADGQGTLALNGQAYRFETVAVEGNLSIGDGASLASQDGVRFASAGNHRLTLEGTGTVTSPIFGGTGYDTLAFNLGEGQARDLSSVGAVTDFEALAASGAGMLNIDREATYRDVLIEGGHISVASNMTLTADQVTGSAQNDMLTVNAGAHVNADVALGDGSDTVNNYGTIDGDLDLGAGNDRYIARSGGVVTGTIDGGAGDNTFIFSLAGGNGSIPGDVLNFNSFGAYGPGTLTVSLDKGQDYTNLEILEGANLVLTGNNGSVGHIIGDDSSQSVTIDGALTGGVSLGGGNDTLTMNLSGLLEGALDGGAGTDTLNLHLTGAASINGMYGFEIANIAGTAPLTLTGDLGAGQQVNFTGDTDNELIIAAGVKFEGTVNGGGGHDLLRVQSGATDNRTVVASQIVSFEELISEGGGTLALTGGDYSFDSVAVDGGNLELGSNTHLTAVGGVTFDGANSRFTLGSGARVTGMVDGGAGHDTLALIQNAGTVRLIGTLQQTGFETLEVVGAGELRLDQDAAFAGGVHLDGGIVNVTEGHRLTADIAGGTGADRLIVGGTVQGNVDLGAGDDTLLVTGLNAITGTVTGGAGTDRLTFNTAGTSASPTAFNGSGYSSFEILEVAGGVISMTGETSWDNVTISGGRLIGQAGSVITSASAIQIAKGATFGSAGIVNADIVVAGTLSPGASPGTMTVHGNVSFAAGSNLVLEVSPTVSDLLKISGKLVIAEGAAVDITGVLHGTPGNMLDLIVAEGGITGRFTTINKSSDIFGFVVQNGNKLQIQSEFLNDATYPGNVRASVAYANDVLRAGYGVQAFTAALPVLVDANGKVSQSAFASLTPEAYGSAIQLGVENGLTIVDGVRAATPAVPGREGLFSFGQFLHGLAHVEGQGRSNSGALPARMTQQGFFGGIGYGFEDGSQLGAFVGGLRGDQATALHANAGRTLGTKTKMDSLAVGVFADTSLAGFGLHGILAFDGGQANTSRDMPVTDSAAKASYDLTGWIADLRADYAVRLGEFTLTPKVGMTYARTMRAAAIEKGAGDFSLSIDKGSKDSWFGEAALAASGSFDLGGMKLSPYAQMGVRQMLSDPQVKVVGRFTGASSEILVNGAERERTAMRVELGLGLDLTSNVRVQAAYTGEYAGTKRDSVMGGLSVRF